MPKKAKKIGMSKNKKRRIGPYREQDFQTYVMWKSLPSVLRGYDKGKLNVLGFYDEIAIDLLLIRTQTEFARKYGIKDLGTLTDWNKKINSESLLQKPMFAWMKRLTPNVCFSLYRNAMKEGDAARVKLWFQLVEGFVEKGETRLPELKEATDIIRKILERR